MIQTDIEKEHHVTTEGEIGVMHMSSKQGMSRISNNHQKLRTGQEVSSLTFRGREHGFVYTLLSDF